MLSYYLYSYTQYARYEWIGVTNSGSDNLQGIVTQCKYEVKLTIMPNCDGWDIQDDDHSKGDGNKVNLWLTYIIVLLYLKLVSEMICKRGWQLM